ncbi:MAG TPA: radical SAM protein [Geobacteraceae bacterium]
MRVLLAYKAHAAGSRDPFTALLPVGLVSLHGVLGASGHRSQLANLSGLSWQETGNLLRTYRPELVGISQFTHNRAESLRLARLAKEIDPACWVVLGGPHATHAADDLLLSETAVDAVVLGEAEETLPELVRVLATAGRAGLLQVAGLAYHDGNEVRYTVARSPVTDLDRLPLAASRLADSVGVDWHRQLEFIITSRGCPAACRFCSSPLFWGKSLRFRSPRSIVDELRFLRDQFGLLYFSIRDDTFTADRERAIDFCRLLLAERLFVVWNCQSRVNYVDEELLGWLKRAGCECVQLGVETGSPRLLRELGKAIRPEQTIRAADAVRRVGLNLSIYLITGIPGETDLELQETLALIERLRPHDGQVSPLVYYPGTSLFNHAVARGDVSPRLFATSSPAAYPVRHDPFVERAQAVILQKLTSVGDASAYLPRDFRAHKKLLGYCHVTNLLAGKYYEGRGGLGRALMEYDEIVRQEPDNPWGWLLRGEVAGAAGELELAREAFARVTELVPRHAPAYAALGEVARLTGDRLLAADLFQRALALDPLEPTARARLGGQRTKKSGTR